MEKIRMQPAVRFFLWAFEFLGHFGILLAFNTTIITQEV